MPRLRKGNFKFLNGMKRFFIWILPLLVACNFGEKGRAIDVNAVKIDAGIVSGKIIGDDDVKLFLGIPYAAPPLGSLRWKAPQAVQPWQGTRVCVENPPSCFIVHFHIFH